ncbi:hypothetical protein JVU11DRAFT_173 [Chiua virens]|nr:hypothetical protein JVU11DRAFT_173 [Chiua virens]
MPPHGLSRSFSADHQYSSFAKPLSGRYDFASAYKTQWARSALPAPNRHTRMHTYPSGGPTAGAPTTAPRSNTSIAHETKPVSSPPSPLPQPRIPPLSLRSPRESMDSTPTGPTHSQTCLESPSPSHFQDGRERNHRRTYIDKTKEGSPTLRRTPTGSPLRYDLLGKDTVAPMPRTRSYPLAGQKLGSMENPAQQSTPKPLLSIQTAPVGDGRNEEPTPYATSQSSSTILLLHWRGFFASGIFGIHPSIAIEFKHRAVPAVPFPSAEFLASQIRLAYSGF